MSHFILGITVLFSAVAVLFSIPTSGAPGLQFPCILTSTGCLLLLCFCVSVAVLMGVE